MNIFRKHKQPTTTVPDGMSEIRVYTYDGRPLMGVHVGDTFLLTLMDGERKMTSVYTGTQAKGNTALSYSGKPIGFLTTSKNASLLLQVRDKLGPLLLHATIEGIADEGWPMVVVRFDRKWALDASA